jgi:hypothetical protein
MLYEFAVNPELLADINHCQTIFFNFKPEKGKVIADVPRNWQQEAFQAINGIPHDKCAPVMKKTLKENLKKFLSESLCRNRQDPNWDRNIEDWLKLVIRVNESCPFSAVLNSESLSEPIRTYSISRLVFDAPECWNAPTECDLPRKARDIINSLIPLLKLSKSIQLIDMHLYPGDPRSKRVLIELLRRVSEFNFGQGVKKIIIHSSDHRKDLQTSLEQHIAPYLPVNFELQYRLWPDSIEHDRFLITDIGGLFLGHGFDEHRNNDDAEEVFISLISKQKCRRLLSKFSGTPTYSASISKP